MSTYSRRTAKYRPLLAGFLLLIGSLLMTVTVLAAGASAVTVEGSHYLAKGKKITLKPNQSVTWKSSNVKIATVSSKGVVKGIKAGKVTITAASKKNASQKKKWKITVLKKAVTSIKISGSVKTLDLNKQKTVTLKAKVLPSSAAQSVTWKSSNPSVAKVNGKGKVTAVKTGTAKITATAVDGSGRKGTITIKVLATKKQSKKIKVGLSFPTDAFMRWKNDGQNMKKLLQNAGYTVDLKYADNDPARQISQISDMIDEKCGILVIAAVEGSALGEALDRAAEYEIPVIAYDRLLRDSSWVSCYVTFDNYEVGTLQGNYIKNALNLTTAKGPFNLEITAGDPGDDNARLFYDGAMDVLRPFIDSGKLVVRSNQIQFEDVATPTWATEVAQSRAENILSSMYADNTEINAWLCSNDSTALGITSALLANYTGSWPVITGQDCDLQNMQNIIAGRQSMSVYKPTTALVKRAVSAVKSLAAGKIPAKDASTDNGVIKVPTLYAAPKTITKNNYTTLINDGIYTRDMLE